MKTYINSFACFMLAVFMVACDGADYQDFEFEVDPNACYFGIAGSTNSEGCFGDENNPLYSITWVFVDQSGNEYSQTMSQEGVPALFGLPKDECYYVYFIVEAFNPDNTNFEIECIKDFVINDGDGNPCWETSLELNTYAGLPQDPPKYAGQVCLDKNCNCPYE